MKKTVIKKIAIGLLLGATVLPAQAISRYQSTSLTCDQVQNRIARDGAAIMRWTSARNPGLPLYDRYVANAGFCLRGETTAYDYIPASNTNSCPVLSCKDIQYDDLFGRD